MVVKTPDSEKSREKTRAVAEQVNTLHALKQTLLSRQRDYLEQHSETLPDILRRMESTFQGRAQLFLAEEGINDEVAIRAEGIAHLGPYRIILCGKDGYLDISPGIQAFADCIPGEFWNDGHMIRAVYSKLLQMNLGISSQTQVLFDDREGPLFPVYLHVETGEGLHIFQHTDERAPLLSDAPGFGYRNLDLVVVLSTHVDFGMYRRCLSPRRSSTQPVYETACGDVSSRDAFPKQEFIWAHEGTHFKVTNPILSEYPGLISVDNIATYVYSHMIPQLRTAEAEDRLEGLLIDGQYVLPEPNISTRQ